MFKISKIYLTAATRVKTDVAKFLSVKSIYPLIRFIRLIELKILINIEISTLNQFLFNKKNHYLVNFDDSNQIKKQILCSLL